ncbi:hypothetical protein K466DRAFT_663839 [Polyporus arcularius HHB13444]|uniref:F-box domain-containing protein n=1 Tax=Polyporus arcularius HHB13444 TaxID=1314778 RepID=A0A5C3PCI7_9APHY|nr:hypothetical protein K466DRAFT_663839 [Polyporus arcularius HHB13444]
MSKLQDLSPDSLRLICTQFDHLYDLTVLARTCRLLSQHAVREIWRVIPSFAVLAYTLPSDAWISTCKLLSRDETLLLWAEKVYTLSFTRPLAHGDLVRLNYYAPFVKAVSNETRIIEKNAIVLAPDAWLAFEVALMPGCLPNLRSVNKCDNYDVGSVEPIGVFLTPYLQELDYNLRMTLRKGRLPAVQERSELALALNKLGHIFTKLKARPYKNLRIFSLSILSYPHLDVHSVLPAGLITDAVCNLSRLVKFECGSDILLQPQAVQHLSRLPTLRSVDAHMCVCDVFEGVAFGDGYPFPALHHLRLHTDSLPFTAALVRGITSSTLKRINLSLKIPAEISDEQVLALTSAVGRHPSRCSINYLYIDFFPLRKVQAVRAPASYNMNLIGRSPHVIAPLYALCSLQQIHLGEGCYGALNNATLAQIGRSWPYLRQAQFGQSRFISLPPSDITLGGLAPLADLLQLTMFNVPMANVDRSDLATLLTHMPPAIYTPCDHDNASAGMVRPSCPLKVLDVGASLLQAEDIPGVAAVLSQWFPSIRFIWHNSPFSYDEIEVGITEDGTRIEPGWDQEQQNERWGEVQGLICPMAMVRRQEQRRRRVYELLPTGITDEEGN